MSEQSPHVPSDPLSPSDPKDRQATSAKSSSTKAQSSQKPPIAALLKPQLQLPEASKPPSQPPSIDSEAKLRAKPAAPLLESPQSQTAVQQPPQVKPQLIKSQSQPPPQPQSQLPTRPELEHKTAQPQPQTQPFQPSLPTPSRPTPAQSPLPPPPPQTPPSAPYNSKNHLPRPQKSNRSIRSTPIPPNHILLKQHSTNPATYHRQYVLLHDKNPSSVSPQFSPTGGSGQVPPLASVVSSGSLPGSPQLNATKSLKSKPHPKREPSRFVFSVEDNEDEIEEDMNREYMEGYSDALRQRRRSQRAASQQRQPSQQTDSEDTINLLNNSDDNTIRKMPSRYSVYDESSEIENNAADQATQELHDEFSNSGAGSRRVSTVPLDMELEDEDFADNENENDNDNDNDANSISSNESFTLRERQDAINETHPFGIRIWKPAVYKKHRSVEQEADNDIHSTPQTAGTVGNSVKIFNFLWSITFGLLLLVVCILLGSITVLCSIFTNQKKDDSMRYARLYYNLGFYFLSPFGKIVLLKSDNNYIQEDAHVGTSLAEFRRWRSQNEGRLFFSAPNALKSHVTETTPLNRPLDSSFLNNNDDNIEEEETTFKKRLFGRGQWNVGRVVFFISFYTIIFPLTSLIALVQWLAVFTIPMAKVLVILANHIRRHPLALSFEPEQEYYEQRVNSSAGNESILICTYRSFGLHYYKYTVDGTNIFFINLNFLVGFTIFDYFVLRENMGIDSWITDPSLVFVLCLASIIPLAYFIGQAVASISAQTSMGVGAVINAFFSTIVEVFLYCVALDQSKGKLVEGSLIGSILGAVLLLPGTSMCSGALNRKTQRYNPASAGVSSTMLLYATLVMLSPTILHQIFGQYEERCRGCSPEGSTVEECKRCHSVQSTVVMDRLYLDYLRPFSLICGVCLFTAYCIGLLFTLKTHAALIWSTPVTGDKEKHASTAPTPENSSVASMNLSKRSSRTQIPHEPSLARSTTRGTLIAQQLQQQQQQQQLQQQQQQSADGGHDAPNWSRTKSTSILLLATITYAIIAEILVDVVDDVLKKFPINAKFLGLTVFALVPNTTEFVNAILFAMHGNVALSMEIGSAYALQVCLLQIPIIVLYSCWSGVKSGILDVTKMFTLIFPRWDFVACLMSVYMFTYVYAEGKSNYFKGSILILLYIALIIGFYTAIAIDTKYDAAIEESAVFVKHWAFSGH
ncbi:DEKNAAC104693 [Brettanomyces naardenensis]|uniref:DEKNAAC104693 n=1 Tax=Brettanomyces naardenensis TaxID=13370 RepID=A0A448YRH0_BRENA|nr:DEKNAAC104693 [Brettanomyces naardenensis]